MEPVSELNGLVMGLYDRIHFDGDQEFQNAMAKHRGFVAVKQEDDHMTAFILGRDNSALAELTKKWWDCKDKAHPGIIYSVD